MKVMVWKKSEVDSDILSGAGKDAQSCSNGEHSLRWSKPYRYEYRSCSKWNSSTVFFLNGECGDYHALVKMKMKMKMK